MTNLLNNKAQNSLKYTTRLHWITYIKPTILLLAILVVLVFYFVFFISYGIISYFVLGLLLYLGASAIFRILNNFFTKIYISDHTLTLQTGILSRNLQDISLSKYEAMSIHQSFLGRILNFGILAISTGELGQSYLIEKPLLLRDFIKKIRK